MTDGGAQQGQKIRGDRLQEMFLRNFGANNFWDTKLGEDLRASGTPHVRIACRPYARTEPKDKGVVRVPLV